MTVGLLERLEARGFQFCVVDPEGDYEELAIAVATGSHDHAPVPERVTELLRKTGTSVVANLLGVKPEDRPGLFKSLLAEFTKLRGRTGRPHVVVVDEAHHMLPADADPGDPEAIAGRGLMFVTVRPDALPARVIDYVDRVIALGDEPGAVLRQFCGAAGLPEPEFDAELVKGEMVTLSRADPTPRKLRVMPAASLHRRHVRKYAKGTLGEDKSFYFRGPEQRLNLRAQNLTMFVQLADGVDDDTWEFHRRRGDFSRWIESSIKDDDLASEVAALEQDGQPPAAAKPAIRDAIERRYTLPG